MNQILILIFVLFSNISIGFIRCSFDDSRSVSSCETIQRSVQRRGSTTYDDDVPSFVTEEMNERELLELSRKVLERKLFTHLFAVSIYFSDVFPNDFMNFGFILDSMINSDRKEVVVELSGLWNYFLSLQINPGATARNQLIELIENNRFFSAFEELLKVCKNSNYLCDNHKQMIVNRLFEPENLSMKLSIDSFSYLYRIPVYEIFNVIQGLDDAEYDHVYTDRYLTLKLDVHNFEDIMKI